MTEQDLMFLSLAAGWLLFCIIGMIIDRPEK